MIDTHFHITSDSYEKTFSYLDGTLDFPCIRPAIDRRKLLEKYKQAGIQAFIDPGIGMSYNERSLEVYKELKNTFQYKIAIGNHPGKCFDPSAYQTRIYNANGFETVGKRKNFFFQRWKYRKTIEKLASDPNCIAIGETGFDYRKERRNQHWFEQTKWFIFHILLADQLGKPLILHIRGAGPRAIKLLRKYKNYLHTGVWHCFCAEDVKSAKEYAQVITQEFGFCIGIGGYLLTPKYENILIEVIKYTDISKILLETDGPYCCPPYPNKHSKTTWERAIQKGREIPAVVKLFREKEYKTNRSRKLLSNKKYKKARNTSLVLQMVINRIAKIKGMQPTDVERITTENSIRVFPQLAECIGANYE